MMKRLLILNLIISLAALVEIGCAPKLSDRAYENTDVNFGPRHEDTVLKLSSPKNVNLNWSSNVSSAEFFQMSEDLLTAGQLLSNNPLASSGDRLVRAFYESPNTTTQLTVQDSPYLSAAIGETKDGALRDISQALAVLIGEQKKISAILDESGKALEWPKKGSSLEDSFQFVVRFLEWFETALSKKNVDPRVLSGITQAIQETRQTSLKTIENRIQQIHEATTLQPVLDAVNGVVTDLGVKLNKGQQTDLEFGHRLHNDIVTAKEPEDIFKILLEIWQTLTPDERQEAFVADAPELYEFLKARDADEIECLMDGSCWNPYLLVARSFKILPQIKDIGVESLKTKIMKAARDSTVGTIELAVVNQLPALPSIVNDKVVATMNDKLSAINKIQKDYEGFLQDATSLWATTNLKTLALRGVEADQMALSIKDQKVSIKEIWSNDLQVGGKTIGASFSALGEQWRYQDKTNSLRTQERSRSVFEQVNKLLALGGYHKSANELAPAFAIAINAPAATHAQLDLRQLLKTPYLFAVPDQVQVSKGLTRKPDVPQDVKVSADTQAELLRGLSHLISYFRDWEHSSFDETLGKAKIADYVKNFPTEDSPALFPKDSMFALSFANASVILTGLMKELSPVFLLSTQNKLIWANEFNSEMSDPVTAAGVVSIEKGERQEIVKSQDVSRYILAMVDFLDAIDGIEKTKSPALQEKDKDGRNAVIAITEAKDKLRLLLVGLANFLSHQMTSADGGIQSDYSLARHKTVTKERSLMDQILAIRALMNTGRVLNLSVYRAAAIDVYFFMNRTLFQPEFNFYSEVEGAPVMPSPMAVASTLRGLGGVRPYLQARSLMQMDALLQGWINTFANLQVQ